MYVISPAPRGRRTEVRGQPRDEGVLGAAEGALGASGGARKDGGRRETGDVDVARRRRDCQVERRLLETAAEVGGLVDRGQGQVQPRDEGVVVTAENGLGTADGAREVGGIREPGNVHLARREDRKSTRLNSSHLGISYAVFCLKK